MKSSTPYVAITFLLSLLLIVGFFMPGLNFGNLSQELQNWAVIIAAFDLGLAAINLTRIHGRRIMLRDLTGLTLFCFYFSYL
ncbi:MAG: hypothetical protein ACLFPS_08955 [Clostridia bacterium]